MDIQEDDENLSQSQILPKILVPNKLLTQNNFKYHMKNVSNIIDYAKQVQTRAQTTQNPNIINQSPTNQMNLDNNHRQSISQGRFSQQSTQNFKFQASNESNKLQTKTLGNSQSVSSLLYTARNFGITNSYYFNSEKSSYHSMQRYGKMNSNKLKPIRKTKSGKFFESFLGQKPKREFMEDISKNQYYKKIIEAKNFKLEVTFHTFIISLKDDVSTTQNSEQNVQQRLNFNDTLFLSKHSFEYITTFFQKHVSYNEPRQEIYIDWEGFQKIPFIRQKNDVNQFYPSQIYKDIDISDQVMQLQFPYLEFKDINNTKSTPQIYTLSQKELQSLLIMNFENINEYVMEKYQFNANNEDENLVQKGIQQGLDNNNNQKLTKEQQEEFEKQFDSNDKDLVNSVTKIQASFKGNKARKEVQNIKQDKQQLQQNQQIEEEQPKYNNQQNTQQNQNLDGEQIKQEQEEGEEDFDKQFDPNDKELVNSIEKIQASFKGKKARQEVQEMKKKKQFQEEMEQQFNPEDKDLVNSVTKIQANFKGQAARKQTKQKKEIIEKEKKQKQELEEFMESINPEDEHTIQQVTKIQANIKGKMARKQVNQLKQGKQQEEVPLNQIEEQEENIQNQLSSPTKSFKEPEQEPSRDHNNDEKLQDKLDSINDQEEEEDFTKQYDPNDQELVGKITKIQATIKGQQTRKVQKQKQKIKEEFEKEFDPNDAELVGKVTKIQATFKGNQTRKNMNNNNDNDKKQQEEEEDYAKQYDPNDQELVGKITKIQATFKGNQTRKNMNNDKQEEEEDYAKQYDPNDQELVGKITKIQATFKGNQTRKNMNNDKQQEEEQVEEEEEDYAKQYDPNDQELVGKITKIQATFKGNQARKNMNNDQKQEDENQQQKKEQEEEDFTKQYDPNDQELVGKITKIQATIKGKQARKQMNKDKQE